MYCPNCGTPIPDGGVCPNCSQGEPETVKAEKINKEPDKKLGHKYGKLSEISTGSKNYSALLSAFLVFPAAIVTAIDLSFHRYDFWFGYVVGALAVVWIIFVLPALKLFPPAANALISFAAVMGYASFIMYKTGHLEWIYRQALPLFVLFAIFVALDVLLISYKKVSWLTVLSAVSCEAGVYLVAIEATHKGGFTSLRWSPILAAGFISVAAVLLAFAYVGRNNNSSNNGNNN